MAAKSTLGSPPPKNQTAVPPKASRDLCEHVPSTCDPPGGSGGDRREDAFTRCVRLLYASCDGMRGGSRAEGRGGPGNTLASVTMHVWTPQRKECDRREAKRDGEKEAQGEKSVNLMGTFMPWESWVAARLPPPPLRTTVQQTDTSRMCGLYCPNVNNGCIVL